MLLSASVLLTVFLFICLTRQPDRTDHCRYTKECSAQQVACFVKTLSKKEWSQKACNIKKRCIRDSASKFSFSLFFSWSNGIEFLWFINMLKNCPGREAACGYICIAKKVAPELLRSIHAFPVIVSTALLCAWDIRVRFCPGYPSQQSCSL